MSIVGGGRDAIIGLFNDYGWAVAGTERCAASLAELYRIKRISGGVVEARVFSVETYMSIADQLRGLTVRLKMAA